MKEDTALQREAPLSSENCQYSITRGSSRSGIVAGGAGTPPGVAQLPKVKSGRSPARIPANTESRAPPSSVGGVCGQIIQPGLGDAKSERSASRPHQKRQIRSLTRAYLGNMVRSFRFNSNAGSCSNPPVQRNCEFRMRLPRMSSTFNRRITSNSQNILRALPAQLFASCVYNVYVCE